MFKVYKGVKVISKKELNSGQLVAYGKDVRTLYVHERLWYGLVGIYKRIIRRFI